MQQITWNGEKNRPVGLRRPCDCGCDHRNGNLGVGYLTGSDENGNGFTVWVESEAVFSAIEQIMLARAK